MLFTYFQMTTELSHCSVLYAPLRFRKKTIVGLLDQITRHTIGPYAVLVSQFGDVVFIPTLKKLLAGLTLIQGHFHAHEGIGV